MYPLNRIISILFGGSEFSKVTRCCKINRRKESLLSLDIIVNIVGRLYRGSTSRYIGNAFLRQSFIVLSEKFLDIAHFILLL